MQDLSLNRRQWLAGTAAAAAMGYLATTARSEDSAGGKKLALKKAVKIGMVGGELKDLSLADKFKAVKKIGYDGIELNAPDNLTVDEVRAAIDASGLPVHGVVDSVHWNDTLTDGDPAIREKGQKALQEAIKDAKAYGATSVLLVPGVVNEKTYYADAYKRSQEEIRKAIALAEELDIKILLENVWNNFLISPVEETQFIDELESKHVGAYFDVGNIVRYGWPQHWVAALGSRIGKLDIKEFSRKKMNDEGLWKGFEVEIGEGDCDWPFVREELKKIGFLDGWATAEVGGGGEERLTEILERMRKVLDG